MPQFANVTTVAVTSDTKIPDNPGYVYWVAASAGATGGKFQLNNSTDDSGTDLFNLNIAANSEVFLNFQHAPIHFGTAIYCDVPGTNLTVNIGHTGT